MAAAEGIDDAAPLPGEELLRGREIEAQLRRLCRHHSRISTRRSCEADARMTVVLAVDAARRRFVVDALRPEPSFELSPGAVLRLRSRLDGAELVFSAEVEGVVSFDGAPALALRFPETMRLRERRGAYRLPLPGALNLRHSPAIAPQGALGLSLVDISLQGAGALVASKPALQVGDRLHMSVELPGASVPLVAEVRSRTPHGERLRLGLYFAELQPQQLDRLAAAMLRIERQLIRAAHVEA